MRPASRHPSRTTRGFTMVELLVAAAITALVASAAATFVSAVSNASLTTRDVRSAKTEGQFALQQVGRVLREARGIGEVTANAVTLWLQDTNEDDKVDLYEAGVIRYDAVGKQIAFDFLKAAGVTPTTKLTTSQFTSYNTLKTLMPSGDLQTVVWVTNVSSANFTAYPSSVETRIIEATFNYDVNGQTYGFRTACSPKAPADYLFFSATQDAPLINSTRKVRKVFSRWTGYSDVNGATQALSSL